MTNFEKIKQMSVEEMAEFISLVAIAAVQNFNIQIDVIKAQNIGNEKWSEYLEREVQKMNDISKINLVKEMGCDDG